MIYATAALLLTGKLLTNALAPDHVGQFALLLLCAEGLAILANLGLPATLPKILQAREAATRQDTLSSLFSFQAWAAIVVAAAGFGAALLAPRWLPPVESWMPLPPHLVLLLPLLLVAAALRDFLLAGAAGMHAYTHRAGAIMLIATLQAIFFLVLFLQGATEPLPFAVSYLFATAGGAALLARVLARTGPVNWAETRAQLRFSAPLFANNVLNFLYLRADTVLVVYFLGLRSAALYEMARRVPGVLSRFFNAALIPWLPSVSELLRGGDRAWAGALLQKVSVTVAFVGYASTLFVIVVQEPLLRVLFTEDYTAAAPALGPLLVAACLAAQAGILGQALIALERPWWIPAINIALVAASLALNAVLLPRWGLAGAGWSALAAAAISYTLQRAAVARAGVPLREGRGLLVHALFLAAWAVPLYRGADPLPVLAAALVYVAACLYLRAVPTGMWRAALPGSAP